MQGHSCEIGDCQETALFEYREPSEERRKRWSRACRNHLFRAQALARNGGVELEVRHLQPTAQEGDKDEGEPKPEARPPTPKPVQREPKRPRSEEGTVRPEQLTEGELARAIQLFEAGALNLGKALRAHSLATNAALERLRKNGASD